MSMYPEDWPRCPGCGNCALDGHLTCGSVYCGERFWRDVRNAEFRQQEGVFVERDLQILIEADDLRKAANNP